MLASTSFQGKIPLRIFTLDNCSKSVLVNEETTAMVIFAFLTLFFLPCPPKMGHIKFHHNHIHTTITYLYINDRICVKHLPKNIVSQHSKSVLRFSSVTMGLLQTNQSQTTLQYWISHDRMSFNYLKSVWESTSLKLPFSQS